MRATLSFFLILTIPRRNDARPRFMATIKKMLDSLREESLLLFLPFPRSLSFFRSLCFFYFISYFVGDYFRATTTLRTIIFRSFQGYGILFNTRLVILENFQLFSNVNLVLRLWRDIAIFLLYFIFFINSLTHSQAV